MDAIASHSSRMPAIVDRAPAAVGTGIEDLHPDLLFQVLRHLDGPALSTAGCATSRLRVPAADPALWRDLCLSAWPSLRHPHLTDLVRSFPDSHRSFFSDAFSFPDDRLSSSSSSSPRALPTELIAAVDLYHKGDLIFSRVIETKAVSPWFLGSPFRLDALDRKFPPLPPNYDEEPMTTMAAASISPDCLTLSWVIIDPAARRAVNLSSRRPVSASRLWHTGETQVKFAMVLRGGSAAALATVTCGGEEGTVQVREVGMTVEGVEGMCLSGRESLEAVQGALEGQRRGKGWEAVAAARYGEYEGRRRERKEARARRERRINMCCALLGVSLFLCALAVVAFR